MDSSGVCRQLFTSLAGTVPLADSKYYCVLSKYRRQGLYMDY